MNGGLSRPRGSHGDRQDSEYTELRLCFLRRWAEGGESRAEACAGLPLGSGRGGRGVHHERNVVPLEQNPPCQSDGVVSDRGSRTCSLRCGTRTRPPSVCSGRSRSPRGFLLFFLIDISSASSSTKFMYSSNPCQVGSSSAQAQQARAAPKPRGPGLAAHNDPPLDPHVCVLEQPDLHPGLLRCGSGHRMKWHRAHKWGLAAAGSKVVQRLQLRQARARTFCRNLKIRFCARDAREGGTAQLQSLFGAKQAASVW